MSAPTTTRYVARYGTDLDRTQPIRVVAAPAAARHAAVAPRARRSTARIVVAAVLAVLVLAATAAAAFLLGGQDAARSTAEITPLAAPVAPPAASSVPAAAAPAATTKKPGPALVDDNGDAVTPGLATVVTNVYTALSEGDLESVRRAYSATGSDDWLTSSSHLEKSPVREKVLRTLRAIPARGSGGYVYSSGSYTVRFGQGDRYAEPGLLTVEGPWTKAAAQGEPGPAAAPASSGKSSTTSSASSGCTSGTRANTAGGLPCVDIATGTDVDLDGTAGVHGLRPCPPGTTIPSDVNEPTRNASTGKVCAVV